ncbi:hypothetical protein BC830DRAFT_1159951 [Chytriomyces sp. MP71]|nr:hypothetical protein BC830DRAFT_1159951 [Chytriomyces sp. MP71]
MAEQDLSYPDTVSVWILAVLIAALLIQTGVGTTVNILGVVASLALLVCASAQMPITLFTHNCSASRLLISVAQVAGQLGISALELCYVLFTWNRSRSLLRIELRTMYPHLQSLVTATPLICCIPIIPCILRNTLQSPCKDGAPSNLLFKWLYLISLGIDGAGIIIFDWLCLYGFAKFLMKTVAPGESVSEDFLLIAWSGVVTIGFCFLALIVYGIGTSLAILGNDVYSNLCDSLIYTIFTCMFSTLLLLKIRLHWLHLRERAELKKRIEEVLPGTLALDHTGKFSAAPKLGTI